MSHPETPSTEQIALDPHLKPHVDRMARSGTEHPDFDQLTDRIMKQMDITDSLPVNDDTARGHSDSSRWLPHRLFGYAASGLCAFVAAIVLLTGTSQPSFAGVLKRIQEIESLILTSYIDTGPGVVTEVVVYYRAPDQIRSETNTLLDGDRLSSVVTFVDHARQESIVLMQEQKQAMRIQLPDQDIAEDTTHDPLFWLRDLRNLPEGVQYQELGSAMIDGRQTRGYEIEQKGLDITIWADAETDIPLRFDVRTARNSSFPILDFEVQGDVQFNPEIDPSLFDSSIPSNYRVTTIDATRVNE